ncbi:MAG: NAD-dependent epimerase/dehydratase family protein, partial [Planctomycetota bacterium]
MSEHTQPHDSICDVPQLEQLLSEPTERVVETLRRLEGDILVLGAGGKIGPTLCRMARRASDAAGVRRRVIGVEKSVTPEMQTDFESHTIELIGRDMLDHAQLDSLPQVPNVIYMAAMKFGSSGQEALTWALNVYLPGMVCERFSHSRIVAFSTGNVYGLAPVDGSGSVESDPVRPEGDYATSCVGRERIFSHFSRALHIPVALVRLNYANELRYGVL